MVGCGSSAEVAAPQPRPQAVDDPVTAFAPLVRLHPDERRWPIAAREFIDYSTLSWRNEPCFVDEKVAIGAPRRRLGKDAPLPVVDLRRLGGPRPYRVAPRRPDCDRRRPERFGSDEHTRPFDEGRQAPGLHPGEGFYLDLLTAKVAGRRSPDRRATTAYYERRSERVAGGRGLRVTYWLLYSGEGRTVPSVDDFEHEGDWERVSVLLRPAVRPGSYLPVSVRLDMRGRDRDIPWRSLELAEGSAGGATHPVLYAARGSHTLYPSPGSYRTTVPTAVARAEVGDCGSDCPSWNTWRDLRSVRSEPWYGYGGAWGYVHDHTSTSGPLGPSPFR